MMNDELILAIETSCDETSAAVVRNGRHVLSNIVSSQVESHKRFGGVVPEIASRHHVEQITIIVEEALNEADVSFADLDAVAVTEGPGLVGALLIGVHAAKAIAFAYDLPLIGVHHIAGHIYANQLIMESFHFPAIALVVSGGHTELVFLKEHGAFEVIGETRDDAVGEAYDKVARTIGLPYPGGPHIDRLAAEGEPTISLPRAWLEPDSYDFSFSGLKSAVINTVHNYKQRNEQLPINDLAASFQASVIDVLVQKTKRAASEYGVKQIVLAGGVAANKGLRTALKDSFAEWNVEVSIPPLHLCTDNAAMIGAAASLKLRTKQFSGYDLNGNPAIDLEQW
ncbi:tRNA (adenosine(37)-N6)-threonylcarbamoyltransferase complex transferase subunit TsaD [Halalkalibacter sp. AB-rgal2]|uniref:tRNA (adenosine(37)-N6)-threonylcarbamoyltransferase complex transferase subunit TsaD n=1 Tax=Halalkalibacter sp. AB-rgal2 TaxID=3242695 RepID=UPI00359E2788